MTLADFGYPVKALWFYCSGNFILFGAPIFSNILIMTLFNQMKIICCFKKT
jgi:hypothetical protein